MESGLRLVLVVLVIYFSGVSVSFIGDGIAPFLGNGIPHFLGQLAVFLGWFTCVIAFLCYFMAKMRKHDE